jgi:antitoxin YefM
MSNYGYYTIPPIYEARETEVDINQLIEETNETHKPILIFGKKGKAVLVSETDWNAIQETLYLKSIPNLTKSILEEGQTPLAECIDVEDIDW